jgi:hypothetical protein
MNSIRGKVMEYFREYWGINRFMKSVSMAVLICFVWNIIGPNLAYAQQAPIEDKDLRKQQQDNVNVGVMSVKDYVGTQGFTKDEDNVIKRNGNLWGIWDEKKQEALQSTPNGFKANKTVTNIIRQQGEEEKEKTEVLPEKPAGVSLPRRTEQVETRSAEEEKSSEGEQIGEDEKTQDPITEEAGLLGGEKSEEDAIAGAGHGSKWEEIVANRDRVEAVIEDGKPKNVAFQAGLSATEQVLSKTVDIVRATTNFMQEAAVKAVSGEGEEERESEFKGDEDRTQEVLAANGEDSGKEIEAADIEEGVGEVVISQSPMVKAATVSASKEEEKAADGAIEGVDTGAEEKPSAANDIVVPEENAVVQGNVAESDVDKGIESEKDNQVEQDINEVREEIEMPTTGEVISNTVETFQRLQAEDNPDNNPLDVIANGVRTMQTVIQSIDDARAAKNKEEEEAEARAAEKESSGEETALSPEEQEIFDAAKSAAVEAADKMKNLSEKDRKAIAEAKNMDELKEAIGNIKGAKKEIFAALLFAIVAKKENKGTFAQLLKKALILAKAKEELLQALDTKGFKGAFSRIFAAAFFMGKLTPKERAALKKAGSIAELKILVKKLENRKGFFGRALGKALIAKLNKIIAKAEAGEKSGQDGEKDDGKGDKDDEADKYGGYDPNVVDNLAAQTGQSREEVIAYLDKAKADADKKDAENGLPAGTTFNQEMADLKEFLAAGGKITNCATDALAQTLGGVSEGLLALQALSIELGAGNFSKEQSVTADGQLMTSAYAIAEVEKQHGRNSSVYETNLEDFANNLKPGESAIVWVDQNHYVTVSKNEDGTLNVVDPNKNDGKPMTFSKAEFVKFMGGGNQTAVTTGGQSYTGYTATTNANGNIIVTTNSQNVALQAAVLSNDQSMQVRGAKSNPFKRVWKAITKPFKAIGDAFKRVGNWINDKILKPVGQWFSDNWKKIVAIVAAVVLIVAAVIVSVVSFGALSPLLALAIAGACALVAGATVTALGKWSDQKWMQAVGTGMMIAGGVMLAAAAAWAAAPLATAVGTAVSLTGLAATAFTVGMAVAVGGAVLAAVGYGMAAMGKAM